MQGSVVPSSFLSEAEAEVDPNLRSPEQTFAGYPVQEAPLRGR